MTLSADTATGTGHAAEYYLRELVAQGFQFLHPRDRGGELVAVVGVRAHHNVVDVMWLRSEEDAKAIRMPGDEENVLAPRRTLWQSVGGASDVLAALLHLPDEYTAGLIAQQSTRTAGCWVPVNDGHAKWLATAS
ncbi:MAG TPA: hypothetical protein VHW44_07740 [Pseudonocardiaceae bacterium]|jgi:hypothetical protein|nr:hypothetical protein [Pseudonocardiaceae bacterium]